MTLLPNIDPTALAVVLAVVTGGTLLILLALGMSKPVLVRMGWRNMLRRPSQTLLLLCGLVLSTVVMTASFGLWDSFADSTLTHDLAALGNVDESVAGPFTQAQVTSALVSIRHNPNVQAATAIILQPRTLTITSVQTRLTLENVDVYAVPPDFEQVYGSLTDSHGKSVSVADLRPDEVVLSATLAQHFAVQPGEQVQLNLGSQTITSTVRALLSNDLAVIGDTVEVPTPEVILPLARYQQIQAGAPNTICIKNLGPGGMGDSGPNGSRSQAVVRFLQQLFKAPTFLQLPQSVTTFQSTVIEPLKPDIVDEAYLNLNKALLLSTAGQQFYELLPLFTCLLVGAGMLLLALLLILLASERRAELGMSRAVGLQRAHLVQLLLFEGVGNGIVAVVLGVPLGLCAIALELGLLGILSHTPVFSAADPNTVSTPVLLPLHVWLSWQSLVSTCCLSLLTILLAVLLTACWISRTNIVTAIRDLDDSPARRFPLMHALHALRHPPVDAAGQPIQETLAGRFSRRMEAVSSLLWGTWVRGPLCLLGGGVLLALADASEQLWLEQLSGAVGLAGLGLLVRWVLELCPLSWLTPALARRVGVSFIGLGWLVLGLQSGGPFLALFEPFDGVAPPPSALEMLLILLLPVGGMVVLIFTNADLLAALCTFLFRRLRDLAPVSRTSLAYPLTFRFRTGVTMVLLSLVTFLVLLLVTTNLGALQEAQSAASTGGFQLEADILSDEQPQLAPSPQIRAIQSHRLLAQDFSAVGLLRLLYQPTGLLLGSQIRLDLASQSSYTTPYRTALVADDGFLSNTTLSMSARARGYTSDQQVWNAVKDHPGYAVLRYQSHLGLPTSDGFAPFTAEVPDGSTSSAHYHQVTVIGILPSGTHWQAIFLSQRTAAEIIQPPYTGYNFYFFRMQPGVSIAQASRDLDRALSADQPVIQVLGDASLLNNTAITEVLTLFLGGYLALGLLFGALSIGVIASRAVVERRQQIGMLCALGFSRTLVRRSFLIEAGFVITLSVLVGASLALWLAYQVALLVYHDQFPVPVLPIVLILSGSYAVAFVATLLPARQAARLHPAEALRYE